MELLLKIAAGAVTAALCAAVLRKNSPEFALLVMLCAGVWVLIQVVQSMGQVTRTMTHLVNVAKLDTRVVEPVVKVVGISIITRVTGEVCRSAGDSGIAAVVETAGTVLALAATLPLVQAVVEMITGLLV